MKPLTLAPLRVACLAAAVVVPACGAPSSPRPPAVPAAIQAVFDEPRYEGATWGLRVVDVATGEVPIDLEPGRAFYIGSVRKVFTVSELLSAVGPDHHYDTPVYRRGEVDGAGVLDGDLVLVASGDLTMGGRTLPDGSIAISDYDHNEANSLGNAVLTEPDPLAGYEALAAQVAAAGIKDVKGDVIVDDRLFQPFDFRGEFQVRPIFVNDDVVDVTLAPASAGQPATVVTRPVSAAFGVTSSLVTGAPGSDLTLELSPERPTCIGTPGCAGAVEGSLPVDFVPPLTGALPLVQTFRITDPSAYARTVFIEALAKAGVRVAASAVAENPTAKLPPKGAYPAETKVAELVGLPYEDYAKLILKVSYNIGADTSLVLYGLTQGVDTMSGALEVEEKYLAATYGIGESDYHFVDGSGGGETTARSETVTRVLAGVTKSPSFPVFRDALPRLGVDGSLAFVKDFASDPALAGAAGQVRAKTGTYAVGGASGLVLKGQAFGGYVHTKRGRDLAYLLVVNDVALEGLDDLIEVFQDEGRISAILWRDY